MNKGRYTTKRAPCAIALGVFFAAVTGYVLFNDVLTQGAPVTTNHALSLAALVAALSAFHLCPSQFREGAIPSGLALCLIGIAATSYVVISSGARNAETAQAKVAVIESRNSQLERALAELAKAEADLGAARKAVAKECATGRGFKCRANEATVQMQEQAVAEARGLVNSAPPTIDANGGYAHAAKVLAAVPYVTASAEAIETRLELLLPFVVVLIVELGTVTFLHVGLGRPVSHVEPAETRVEPKMEPATPAMTPDNDDGPDGGSSGDVVSWVREFRARHGRNPQIPEVQARFHVPKTTAWRRIKAA